MDKSLKSRKYVAIFDSGFGGLSFFRHFKKENIIYIADNLNAPYGEKSKKDIIEHTLKACMFLKDKNIKCLILACNTASIYAYDILKKEFSFPVFEIISKGVELLKKSKNILVLATKASIRSNFFDKEIKKINKKATVYKRACPFLVRFLEENFFDASLLKNIIPSFEVDTIYLGCSHYIFFKDRISDIFPGKNIIDPSYDFIKFIEKNIEKNTSKNPNYIFYTSKDKKSFSHIAEKLLKMKIGNIKNL